MTTRTCGKPTLTHSATGSGTSLARLARERILKISPDWPWKDVPHLLAAALRPASTRVTSTISPSDRKGGTARRGRSRCAPGHPGRCHAATRASQTDTTPETGHQHNH